MIRYSRIIEKDPREIVLLKSRPSQWVRCFFCDHIEDNGEEDLSLTEFNDKVLQNVTGEFKKLEVIKNIEILWKTTDLGGR